MTSPGSPNAVEQLAAALANSMLLVHGPQAVREGRVDHLALTNPLARLALTRALQAAVPGFRGLWLDLPAVDGPLEPWAPATEQRDDLEAFLRAVLRSEQGGPGGGA